MTEKYSKFYFSLDEKLIPKSDNYKYQENFQKFIDTFPEYNLNLEEDIEPQIIKILPLVIDFIKQYPFSNHDINYLVSQLEKQEVLEIYRKSQKHYQRIIEVIQPDPNSSFMEKKRVYLGMLWFLIGYFVSYVISKVERIDKFPNLDMAAQNNYLVFLTCSFIFYDDILDLEGIKPEDKKNCLGLTQYFFDYLLEIEKSLNNISMEKIVREYVKKKDTNYTKIIEKTSKVLEVFLKAWNEEVEESKDIMVRLFRDLFMTEVRISKIQKENKSREEQLNLTLEKSQKSIYLILKCCRGNQEITEGELDLTYRFSLLSQLLDDLNDMEIDRLEGNKTLFIRDSFQLEIKNTLLYLLDINDYLNSTSISKELKIGNHLANILVYNYSIGKNKTLLDKLGEEIKNYFYLSPADIVKIRVKKLEFQKKLGNFLFK